VRGTSAAASFVSEDHRWGWLPGKFSGEHRTRPPPEKEAGSVEPTIQQGYFPGAVGRITEAHAVYYHDHWGFDASFEIQVATELAAFIASWDPRRDGLWAAFMGDRLAGSIAIDGRQARTAGARLRWFLVLPEFQGAGIGTRLAWGAVAFCRQQGFPRIFLWTFQGLDAARRLYAKCGFALCEEHEVAQWGQRIREQKFELNFERGRSI
jgi:GNAT superfamily N-acetyltransferase